MKAYQVETCKTIANHYGLDSQLIVGRRNVRINQGTLQASEKIS